MDQGSNYKYDYFQMLEALQSRHHLEDLWPMLLLGSGVVEPGTPAREMYVFLELMDTGKE